MAWATSTYYSNSIVGVPQTGADIDILETNATPKFPIGFGFERADGNKYRYCHFAAAVTAGYLVAYETTVDTTGTSSLNLINKVIAPAVAMQSPDETAGIYPGGQYSRYVIIDVAASVTAIANQFKGAYLSIVSGGGAGYTYRIKGNDACSATTTNCVKLQLHEQLAEALTTASDVNIMSSKYANLTLAAAGADAVVAGVVCANPATNRYGWVQTKGIATAAIQLGGHAIGNVLMASSNTTGMAGLATTLITATIDTTSTAVTFTGFRPIIGYAACGSASSTFGTIVLQCE
jgi:hypothetical protein